MGDLLDVITTAMDDSCHRRDTWVEVPEMAAAILAAPDLFPAVMRHHGFESWDVDGLRRVIEVARRCALVLGLCTNDLTVEDRAKLGEVQ